MNTLLLIINSTACGLIALRLMFYTRNGAEHKPLISFMAYLIVVATGSVPIRALMGDYPVHDISEAVLNTVICIAVFAAHGNVSKLFYGLGPQ